MSETWQNRILGSGAERPDQLLANPRNWRIHPKAQQDALAGVLREVGWVQEVIVNQRTGHLVDGHLRVTLALRDNAPFVPVKYVDLSPEEEALILASIDPLSAMAATDAAQLDALLREVSTGDAAVQQMLDGLAQQAGIVPFEPIEPGDLWKGMPEFEQDDRQGIIVTVHFETEADKEDFFQRIGQKHTDKTNSIWYPERPEDLRNQLGTGLVYTDES